MDIPGHFRTQLRQGSTDSRNNRRRLQVSIQRTHRDQQSRRIGTGHDGIHQQTAQHTVALRTQGVTQRSLDLLAQLQGLPLGRSARTATSGGFSSCHSVTIFGEHKEPWSKPARNRPSLADNQPTPQQPARFRPTWMLRSAGDVLRNGLRCGSRTSLVLHAETTALHHVFQHNKRQAEF